MTLFSVWMRLVCGALLAATLGGCYPMGDLPADEEKDPHYLAGKNRLNAMDYDGAITAFENALMSNPKSAAAHLELGFLYEEKRGDYAAAIYHFQRHLELRPESNVAETLKQRVFSCKMELAKTASFALVSRQVQDEIRRLHITNSALYEQIGLLKTQLVEQALFYSNKLVIATQAAAAAAAPPSLQFTSGEERRSAEPERRSAEPERRSVEADRPAPRPQSSRVAPTRSTAPSQPRLHIVKSGETLASISKRYNIKLSALQMANPSVDSRKLKTGQVLNLPAPKN